MLQYVPLVFAVARQAHASQCIADAAAGSLLLLLEEQQWCYTNGSNTGSSALRNLD
jgi:hypothetical protein